MYIDSKPTYILDALAGEEGRPAVGELDDDWRVDVPGGLQHCVDRRGRGAVERCRRNG